MTYQRLNQKLLVLNQETDKLDEMVRLMKTAVVTVILCCGLFSLGAAKETQSTPVRISEEASYQAYQHFVNGDLLELAGNLQAAAEEYKQAVQLNPGLHEARFHLAQLLYRSRDIEDALQQALQLPLDQGEQVRLLAMLYSAKQDLLKAKEYYQQAVQLDSLDINSIFALVQLYQRQKQTDSASAYLEKMSRLIPPNSQSYQQVAEYYFQLGRLPEAVEHYRRAIELDSTNAQAMAGLALVYESQREFRQALNIYQRLHSLPTSNPLLSQKIIGLYYNLNKPDSAIAQAETALVLFPNDLQLKKILGSLYLTQRDFAHAESVFTSLSQANPSDQDIILYLGKIALATRNYPMAETQFQQALNLNDTLTEAWFSLASTYLEQKKFAEAEETYGRYLQKSSDTVGVYIAMGLGYGRAKKYPEAEKYFQQALQLKPSDPSILLALGNLHQQQGQTQKAEEYFLKVMDLQPDNATALNNLGYLWADQGVKLDKSLEMIGKALKQEPDNPAFLDSYGWNLYQSGRLNEAEDYLKRARELLSTDPDVYHHLGDLYFKQGKLKLAKESWQKALELDPDNNKLKEKLGRLK